MTSDADTAVVAVYDSHQKAESAIKKLVDAKIRMKGISVIGKGYHSEDKVVGFYNAGDRIKLWGKYGAFWGGLSGVLAGMLFVTNPVVGPLLVVGSFAAILLTTIEGAVAIGGLSALGAALYSMGVPHNAVLQYEQALKAEGFLIMVQGTVEETERARAILLASDAWQVDRHSWHDNEPKAKIAS